MSADEVDRLRAELAAVLAVLDGWSDFPAAAQISREVRAAARGEGDRPAERCCPEGHECGPDPVHVPKDCKRHSVRHEYRPGLTSSLCDVCWEEQRNPIHSGEGDRG